MNTHDDMRTPLIEQSPYISDAAFMKKLPRFRTDLVHRPVQIFHPMLLVPQHPIIEIDKFFSDVMRLLNGLDRANDGRLAFPKILQTLSDRKRRRTMPAAGVG